MPNFLCFADPSLPSTHDDSNSFNTNGANPPGAAAHESSARVGAEIRECTNGNGNGEEECPPGTALFVREDNKKSSFSLQRPYALISKACDDDEKLWNGEGHAARQISREYAEQEKICYGSADDVELVASAFITSCSLPPDNNTSNGKQEQFFTLETFLFSGFELIANVRTVEVCAVRSENTNDNGTKKASVGDECVKESYLATCKGVSIQDLTPMETIPPYVDGTMPQIASGGSTENIASQHVHVDKSFYAFTFILPGGPKPMKKVRLKFFYNSPDGVNNGSTIIVRTLNVKGRLKGRLSDSGHASNRSTSISNHSTSQQRQQQSSPQQQQLNGDSTNHDIPRFLQNGDEEEEGNLSNLAHHFSKMQENGGLDVRQVPTQLHVRKQAEILSKIPGVNLFIRNCEELTTSKEKKMLSDMEARIMKRLDGISDDVETRMIDRLDRLDEVTGKEMHIMDRLNAITDMETRIMNRLDGIDKRLDAIEQQLKVTGIGVEQKNRSDSMTEQNHLAPNNGHSQNLDDG